MKERKWSCEKKRRKYVLLISFILLSSVLTLILVVKNSDWYHEVFDFDAVSFGRLIKKEKLDTRVTEIRSGYLMEKDGKKISVEVPIEFWKMIVDDFIKFDFGETIEYRMNYVSMPTDDFKAVNGQEIMGYELFLNNSAETIMVKIYEEGFIRIRGERFRIGKEYTKKYYEEGIELLRMEEE